MKMNRESFEEAIKRNIEWLKKQQRTLEREHILLILEDSTNIYYPKTKAKCYNCKHAGHQFKISNLTHLHCEHPKYNERGESGELSPWETLCVFSETCSDHVFKETKKS